MFTHKSAVTHSPVQASYFSDMPSGRVRWIKPVALSFIHLNLGANKPEKKKWERREDVAFMII